MQCFIVLENKMSRWKKTEKSKIVSKFMKKRNNLYNIVRILKSDFI